MKSLIFVKFLTFINFDLNLNYCLNSVLNPLFMGLFCEQRPILMIGKEKKNYIAYKERQNIPI